MNWQQISNISDLGLTEITCRLRVEGGHLYRSLQIIDKPSGVVCNQSMCFVPDEKLNWRGIETLRPAHDQRVLFYLNRSDFIAVGVYDSGIHAYRCTSSSVNYSAIASHWSPCPRVPK